MGHYGYVARDDRGFSILGIGAFSTIEKAVAQLKLIVDREACGITIELWREEENDVWLKVNLESEEK